MIVSSQMMSSGKQQITHGSGQQMEQTEDFSYQLVSVVNCVM